MMRATWLTLFVAATIFAFPQPATAGCAANAESFGNAFGAMGQCSSQGNASGPQGSPGTHTASNTNRPVYRWLPPCSLPNGDRITACAAQPQCPPGQTYMRRWRIVPAPPTSMGSACLTPAEAAAPTITPAMVARAFRRIPLPHHESIAQPGETTLINFDTIFHTTATPLTRRITLLGQRIRLEIQPDTFTWHWGDGTSSTTKTAGAAYPDKSVTHRYADARTTVKHHVSIRWTARWSLNGGPLQPVPGSVTTTGPTSSLRIAEASPTLSGVSY